MRAILIKALLRLLSWLPLSCVHWMGGLFGCWLAKHPENTLHRITRINLSLCFPCQSADEQVQLLRQSLSETCKTFLELGALWLWPPSHLLALVRSVEGEEYMQQAFQRGKGVILMTPHLGAWEMAGLYASAHYPITSWYRPPKLSGLSDLMLRGRQRLGARLVPTNGAGLRALLLALRQGEVAGILPDQVAPAGTGLFAPFFGVPAYTVVAVSRLAHKTGAALILTYAERLPHGEGFRLHFLPAPSAIGDVDDLGAAVVALNQGVESCAKRCLAQYQWSYKRFKMQPLDRKAVY